ncbi:hypothetical protein COT47_02430 [Candidatus Woesearchaeota archaeon CG08_land_8_20_14_0_20_43_7]|nr:MAG: hypothetical protein COT47_02430 [Candidatus Woesearchaeota archaeon CG08_land_8_20_14_0_20_43_7]
MSVLLDIAKATRVERTMPVIATIMIPLTYAKSFSVDMVILVVCCVLTYMAFGLHNAYRDNDFTLPKYSYLLSFALLGSSIFLSVYNEKILILNFLWVLLGLIYNTISRRILFADITILVFTHHVLPALFAGWILGLQKSRILGYSIVIFFVFWFLIQIKNLKGTIEDKERGYATPATIFQNGRRFIQLFREFGFVMMLIPYFFFDAGIVFILSLLAINCVKFVCDSILSIEKNLKITRVLAVVFLLSWAVGV